MSINTDIQEEICKYLNVWDLVALAGTNKQIRSQFADIKAVIRGPIPFHTSIPPYLRHMDCSQRVHFAISEIVCIACSPCGTRAAYGLDEGRIFIVDIITGHELRELRGHTRIVCTIDWSLDGSRIVSGSFDGTTRIWDATTGQELYCFRENMFAIARVRWDSSGSQILSWSKMFNRVNIRHVATGQLQYSHDGNFYSTAWSHDNVHIASGLKDFSVCIWDKTTGQRIRFLRGHVDLVEAVAWSPDDKKIASGSKDRTVRIWNTSTGEELFRLQGHMCDVHTVDWSPDGTKVVSGSPDETVRIWDAWTGQVLHVLRGHTDYVQSVRWTLDGKRIVSGSWDDTIRIWKINLLRLLFTSLPCSCHVFTHKPHTPEHSPQT